MAERKNRSIVGVVRAMLDDQSLPFFLWTEACSTAVYVLNMSPDRALGSKILEDTFTRNVPEIGHFCIFGCFTYSHVPSEKRKNLEATGERGIFVCYDDTSNSFRIYLLAHRKVMVRRDVRFEEEKSFRRSLDSEMEDQQSTPQVIVQSSASQSTRSPVSGVTGSQVTPSGDSGTLGTGSSSLGTGS